MEQQIIKMMKGNPSVFGGQLMQVLTESGVQSHVWHLQTKSYEQHMALNNYYSSIPEHIDTIIEIYQGLHGVRITGNMDIKIDSTWAENKPAEYFKNLRTKLETMYNNENMSHGSLKNLMDGIIELVAKTSYLLTLK
jgi:hypothetical protein